MKKIVILIFGLLMASSAFAQMETVKDEYISTTNIPADLSSRVITSGGVDENEAYKAGWSSANEVWGLEGAGLTLLEEVGEVGALKTINEYCGEMGLGLAFIQLGLDLSEGKKTEGWLNFTKNSFNYAIGKWGWQSLKIASCGVAFIDYALNKFGNTVLGWKYTAWESAYTRYFNIGPGKRSLTEWRQVFQGVKSQEDIMGRINQHLDTFDWSYDTLKTWTAEPSGLVFAEPLQEDKEKIRGSYLNTYLLTYLRALFLTLQKEANYQAWKATQDAYQKSKKVLNTVYKLQVKVVGPKTKIAGLKVAINKWEGATDANGVWKISYTLYGFIKGGGSEIILYVPSEKQGIKELKEKMVLKKDATVVF